MYKYIIENYQNLKTNLLIEAIHWLFIPGPFWIGTIWIYELWIIVSPALCQPNIFPAEKKHTGGNRPIFYDVFHYYIMHKIGFFFFKLRKLDLNIHICPVPKGPMMQLGDLL